MSAYSSRMKAMSYKDRAYEIHERAMEVIHGYVEDAIEASEELRDLADELANETSRERADNLITKIIISLEKIG